MRLANPKLLYNPTTLKKRPGTFTNPAAGKPSMIGRTPTGKGDITNLIATPSTTVTKGNRGQAILTPGQDYQAIKLPALQTAIAKNETNDLAAIEITATPKGKGNNKVLIFGAIGVGLALLLMFGLKGKSKTRRARR